MGIDFLFPQKEKRKRETHPISRHNDALFFFLPRGRWGIVFPGIIFAQKEKESKRNWLCFFFLPSSSENEQLSLFLLSPPSFSLLFPPSLSSQVAERDSPRLRDIFAPSFGTRLGTPEMALEIGKMWQIPCRLVPYKKTHLAPLWSGKREAKQSLLSFSPPLSYVQ